MARFSFGPGGANRQVLRLERLEVRDCPSGLGGHAHTFAGILPAPPTPPPQPHGVIVHHLPAGPVAQPFAGIIEVPPTPPPQPHGVVVHHQPAGPVAQPFIGIILPPPTPPPIPG